MFGKKKKDNPEIRKAMAERDELISDVMAAVHKVDDLLQQYEEANGITRETETRETQITRERTE